MRIGDRSLPLLLHALVRCSDHERKAPHMSRADAGESGTESLGIIRSYSGVGILSNVAQTVWGHGQILNAPGGVWGRPQTLSELQVRRKPWVRLCHMRAPRTRQYAEDLAIETACETRHRGHACHQSYKRCVNAKAIWSCAKSIGDKSLIGKLSYPAS